jgi:VanZ family protein
MLKNNISSILTAAVIMYLCMANSQTFDKMSVAKIPYIDKFVHFGMFFGLMSVLIFENRKLIKKTFSLFYLALIPLSYGIIIELMQAFLTTSRSGSIFDALADLAGISVSVLICLSVDSIRNRIIR